MRMQKKGKGRKAKGSGVFPKGERLPWRRPPRSPPWRSSPGRGRGSRTRPAPPARRAGKGVGSRKGRLSLRLLTPSRLPTFDSKELDRWSLRKLSPVGSYAIPGAEVRKAMDKLRLAGARDQGIR